MTNPLVAASTYNKRPLALTKDGGIDPDKMTRELGLIEGALKFSTSLAGTVFNVMDFGNADPSGARDSQPAIQRALDAAVANGGGTLVGPAGRYRLTTSQTVDLPFPISAAAYQPATLSTLTHLYALNPTGITFEFPGSTFFSEAVDGGNNDAVILFDGAQDCVFNIGRIESASVVNQSTGNLTTTGRTAIELHSTERDSFNVQVPSLVADSCFAAVYIAGVTLGSYRVRGTRLGTITLENGYRGLMLFDNGDDTTFDCLQADTATRLFFIFGCDGVYGHAHCRSQLGGFQSLIKAYDRDTLNVGITYRTVNANTGSARLGFSSEHNVAAQPTPAALRNIAVHYDDTDSGHPAPGIDFGYLIDGTPTGTVASTIFDNIHLSGTMDDSTLVASVQQTPAGLLSLDGLVVTGTGNPIPDYAIFADAGFYPLAQMPSEFGFRMMRASPNETSLSGGLQSSSADNVQLQAQVGHVQLLAPTGKAVQAAINGTVVVQVDASGLELRAAAAATDASMVALGNATQSTVGAAGGASGLPVTPSGYLRFFIGSTEYVLPYYAQA